ncbi:MAG: hypothetical protein JWL98_912 [Xanthomonadaceae bacterium]|nr:hypothetical protein [Xanthomonadaceae bacterium]
MYECASSAGHSYQQIPCPPKFKTLRTIETDQVTVTRRGATYASRSSRSPFRQTSAVDPCNAAKAARASTLQAMGLDRTFDRLSALDRSVAEACRR